jgi:predicted membrane protein
MNDVLNSQGYTQFAWWNRMPVAAWGLMTAIATCCNLLIGYGARRRSRLLFLVLPLAVSIAFFLIADIDSPRRGLILVQPQNLISLSQSLRSH